MSRRIVSLNPAGPFEMLKRELVDFLAYSVRSTGIARTTYIFVQMEAIKKWHTLILVLRWIENAARYSAYVCIHTYLNGFTPY